MIQVCTKMNRSLPMLTLMLCSSCFVFGTNFKDSSTLWNTNGYVFFCLCMGRFGNQVEHFLGGLAFAKALNRTLVIPPWITYKTVTFSEWFEVDPLRKYHNVILAEEFMKTMAPKHWPKGSRKGYCWLPPGSKERCIMKEGFPFKTFWDDLGVDFDDYVVYHLSFYADDHYVLEEWKEKFPPSKHPVLAFRGAPASFPIQEQHRHLQRLLQWSSNIKKIADEYITKNLRAGPFIGIHLRNEEAWKSSCQSADGLSNFMASPQCLGYSHYKKVTRSMCDPPKSVILSTLRKEIKRINAQYIFVATDHDPMISELEKAFGHMNVTITHLNPERPQIDLAILGQADHFIGNCVSSFTAFVKRQRDVEGKPSSFWAFDGHIS